MKIKELFKNKKIKIASLITASTILVFVFELIGFFIVNNTKPYLLDQFYNEVAATMGDGKDKTIRTILNIKKDKDAEETGYVFSKLMSYSSGNNNFGDFRTVVNNRFTWNGINLHLETQSNFYTSYATDDYGYKYIHIDYDTYSLYFLDSELINRAYGNHDTFLLISDVFARRLINYYHLDDGTKTEKELFKELVLNENVGSLIARSTALNIDFRITNIIRTDYLHGIRTNQIYGDFGVFYLSNNIDKNKLEYSFEFDLKNNPLCIKNTFSFASTLGYGVSKDYQYSFKTYSDGHYLNNSVLTNNYYSALSSPSPKLSTEIIVIILVFAFNIIYIFGLYFLSKKIREVWVCSLVGSLIFLVIYGIIANFIYIYPLLSLLPVFCAVESFAMSFEEIRNAYKRICQRKKKQD